MSSVPVGIVGIALNLLKTWGWRQRYTHRGTGLERNANHPRRGFPNTELRLRPRDLMRTFTPPDASVLKLD